MDESVKEQIRKIMEQIRCPKGYTCVKNDFKDLCKGRDIGLEQYLECLDEGFSECGFALRFGEAHYCTCELRIFLAKRLKL